MNKNMNKNIKQILTVSIIIIFVFVIILIINYWITDKKNQSNEIALEAEILRLEQIIENYRTEYDMVLEIKSEYRESISRIFELLYNRSAPLQIGGSDNTIIEESDRIVLLQLRQTIQTMEDDQRILDDVEKYLMARRTFIQNFPFTWPIETNGVPRISSGYGFREGVIDDGLLRFHRGIDIPGSNGDPIIASADGKVRTVILDDQNMGDIIVLEHRFGFTTGYSHLQETFVIEGQEVERGDIIGEMGDKGLHSFGAHIHYEIRKDNTPIDPMLFLSINY